MPVTIPEDPSEAKRVKAQEWESALSNAHYPIVFTYDGISVTIHSGAASTHNGVWYVWVEVSTAAGSGLDHHRIEIINPPLGVPDGQGVLVQNTLEAAKQVLTRTVRDLVGL